MNKEKLDGLVEEANGLLGKELIIKTEDNQVTGKVFQFSKISSSIRSSVNNEKVFYEIYGELVADDAAKEIINLAIIVKHIKNGTPIYKDMTTPTLKRVKKDPLHIPIKKK